LACRVLQYLENEQFPNDLGEFKVGGIVYLSEISNYKINVANIFSGLLQLIDSVEANKIDALYREGKIPIDEKIRALLAVLPQEPVILLLDNFEDLLNSEDAINDQELETALKTILQADSHHLKVLTTTRMLARQFNMFEPARQHILHLEEGLPSPFAENVLRKMDKDGRAGFRDAPEELLGRIKDATLGYPRALESLYAILRVDRYTDVEELLVEGLPETVVEKFVGEAFSRLDITSQKIIQTVAVYNRPVSSAAVDFALQFHVPGVNSSPILERLVSMHFVRREAKRYFLHPADRHYALSRMALGDTSKRIGQGARARTWNQHSLTLRAADYFVQVRKPLSEWKKLDDLGAQLAEFELRCAADDYNTAASVLNSIDFEYLLLWGHYQLMVDLHAKIDGKISDTTLARISTGNLGLAFRNIGQIRRSIEYCLKALESARKTNNRQAEGTWLSNLGIAYSDLGDTQKAIQYYEQALILAREVGDQSGEGAILGNLGNDYGILGDLGKAVEYHEQALAIDRQIRNRRGESADLGNLGNTYAALGDIYKSIELYEQALRIAHEIGSRHGIGVQVGNLGSAYDSLGDLSKALDYYEQALAINREISNRGGEHIVLNNLGKVYDDLGNTSKAIELYEQALIISHEIGDRGGECSNLTNYGNVLTELNDLPHAMDKLNSAISIADEINWVLIQNSARYGLAISYLYRTDLANARINVEAALQYDIPQNNHTVHTLHGIIVLRQKEVAIAYQSFMRAITQANEILAKTPEFYRALDAKGLALCGLALCDDRKHGTDAFETFRKARKLAPHAGIIRSMLRLFDELVKCDEEGILKDVRKAAEGKE
jgi:tetratricopeptide (TPR) repeat protein